MGQDGARRDFGWNLEVSRGLFQHQEEFLYA